MIEETEPLGQEDDCMLPAKAGVTSPEVSLSNVSWIRNDSTANERISEFRKRLYPHVFDHEWNNWRWQIRNRITTVDSLERIMRLSDSERSAVRYYEELILPFAITPYYASLLDPHDPAHALRRAVVPVIHECMHSEGEAEDPLKEDEDSPVPGIVHRYPDRVLFLVTDFCSTYCRYCTRSRMVGMRNVQKFVMEKWSRALRYIEERTEIRDVLLSGGDPLTLSDEKLEWFLSRLRRIPHIEVIRIGTKVPVVLPQRITLKLTRMIRRYHPLWMSIHFTHPDELTNEVSIACGRLADAGIPLQSQTVLLSGVNDSVEVMRRLVHGLVMMRVRPYYLYQCDPIVGSAHFRTPVQKGLEIINGLRGYTSGFAVPLYVIDAPGGGGKVPIVPDYLIGREGNNLLLRNYEGRIFRYCDPQGERGSELVIN